MSKIEINQHDIWILLSGFIRYALGRRSTAPGSAYDLVVKYCHHLETWQLNQIYKEIKRELEIAEDHYKTVGDQCDHDVWWLTVNFLKREAAKRET